MIKRDKIPTLAQERMMKEVIYRYGKLESIDCNADGEITIQYQNNKHLYIKTISPEGGILNLSRVTIK